MSTSYPPLIYNLDFHELKRTLDVWKEPGYRTQQIWQGLYHHLWNHPEQFTNLPLSLRTRLAQTFAFSNLQSAATLDSSDQETRKTLFRLPDGKSIEAVLMRYHKRRTLCISTQAGCAMGCVFCATGQMGFKRHLSSGEIVEQVLFYARQLAEHGEQVTNVVIMGMGEPFHNYDATMQAMDRLNHPDGFNFGFRRFTVSTVGLVPAIEKFTEAGRPANLAISLHAIDDELRTSLMPINSRYPVDDLLNACQDYVKKTHRRITFEWALIENINDSPEQADKLAKRLQVFRSTGAALCHVNVIPLNPTKEYTGKATSAPQALVFQSRLDKHGIPCTVRLRRGIDIQAGCGQLAIESQ